MLKNKTKVLNNKQFNITQIQTTLINLLKKDLFKFNQLDASKNIIIMGELRKKDKKKLNMKLLLMMRDFLIWLMMLLCKETE
jgi:hypothetical protein